MAASWPIGKTKSILPNKASLIFKVDLISGMRLAHVEKQNPIPKKNSEVANLTLLRYDFLVFLKLFLILALGKILDKKL